MKKALVQVQGVFSELEKGLLVLKLQVARQRKRAKEGKCEGRKSYREIAPEILSEIRRLRRKPKGRRRMSYEMVADALNEQGFVNRNGGQFTGNTVRGIVHRSRA